jgi:outer membrane protein assembly factor BamB
VKTFPLFLSAALILTASAFSADWPQWRGPLRNGIAPDSPKLADSWPEGGPAMLWESEPIPSNDDGGLGSVVVAKSRAYLSVVWQSAMPAETRQIDEYVLRQLGFQPTNALGREVVAKMEQTRETLPPSLRGKKLDEFAEKWIAENLDKKQRQLFTGYVTSRFKLGKFAFPLDVLDKLDANKQRVFASDAEMRAWLDAQGWSGDIKQRIADAVPPTKRVAEDVVICLDLASGKTLWKTKSPGEPTGRGSSSTPCVAGGKVFALGSTHAYCVDAESGALLWSSPLVAKGPGSSPLVADGVLVVNAKHLAGYDAATGKLLWQQEKAGGGNSSPVVWNGAGGALVICNGRDLTAVNPANGEIVWSAPGGGDSTPAIAGDRLAVQSRKPEIGLVVYNLSPGGADKVWNHPADALRTQSSPIVHDGCVYLMDDGIHACFDLATGKQLWQETVPSAISSPVLADGKLFVMVNNANTISMLRPGRAAPTELASAKVHAQWVPSPAIADGKLLLRMKDRIKCFDLAGK